MTSTTGRGFIDTNVLVHAYDSTDPAKQEQAQRVIAEGLAMGEITLSAQVLSEFFVAVTRRSAQPIEPADAREIVELFDAGVTVPLDHAMVQRAIDTQGRYQMNYWDALIVAAAERGGCDRILSEDLSAGQSYWGIVVEDPFETTAKG